MSVVIKGYEAVDYCSACEFSDLVRIDDYGMKFWCCLLDGIYHDKAYHKPISCPIIPLPEKHGRLVDCDEIKKNMILLNLSTRKWISEAGLSNIPTVVDREDSSG